MSKKILKMFANIIKQVPLYIKHSYTFGRNGIMGTRLSFGSLHTSLIDVSLRE